MSIFKKGLSKEFVGICETMADFLENVEAFAEMIDEKKVVKECAEMFEYLLKILPQLLSEEKRTS